MSGVRCLKYYNSKKNNNIEIKRSQISKHFSPVLQQLINYLGYFHILNYVL